MNQKDSIATEDERREYLAGCAFAGQAMAKIKKRINPEDLLKATSSLEQMIATVLYATGEAMRLDGVEVATELWFAPDTWRTVVRVKRDG